MVTEQENQTQDKERPQSLPVVVPEEPQDLAPLTTIKTEANFAGLPFFALSRQDAARKTRTEYRTVLERNDQKFEALWQVVANPEYGYPSPFDRKVHKAIEYLITERGVPAQNPLPFTAYRILQLLGLSPEGKNVRQVRETFERIIFTGIKSEGTFYDKAGKQYITDVFHLYDRVVFKGKTMPDGSIADANYLFLSSWYLSSLNAHYVRPIDFQYLKSLQSDIAGRLYELLGLKFYGLFRNDRPYWRIKYSDLCSLLPITPQRKYSDAQRYLAPAHEELTQTGFLAKVEWEKERKDLWDLFYYPGQRAKEEYALARREPVPVEQLEMSLELPEEAETGPGPSTAPLPAEASAKASAGKKSPPEAIPAVNQGLADQLTTRGINPRTATRLVKAHSAEQVARHIEVFDWTRDHQPEAITDNPAGFLRKMIEENWSAPDGFVSRSEQDEKQRDRAAAEQELLAEYLAEWAEVEQGTDDFLALPPEQQIAARFDLWESEYRRRHRANPTEEERQKQKARYLESLPTKEQLLASHLQDLRYQFEQKAKEQGITFTPPSG